MGRLLFLAGMARGQSPDTVAWMQQILVAIEPLPWIIFYDSAHAWHVNPDLKLLPGGRRQTRHLLRYAGGRKAFFVMGLPEFLVGVYGE